MDSVKKNETSYIKDTQRNMLNYWVDTLNSTSVFITRDANGKVVVANAEALEDIFEQIDHEKAVLLKGAHA
ncbi:hypothetical protein [Secundilactobacillus muriivasis]